MDASIVIVSYNGRDFLRRCLASIYEHTHGVAFEVVVVDNASVDGTPEMVEEEFPQATLVRRRVNAGFARGVNEGVANARGEAMLILNPDTEFRGGVLPPMLEHLSSHPDIGILAPKLLDPDGSVQLSCRAFPRFETAIFNRYSLATRLLRGNPFSARYLMTNFDHNQIADVDWASAAAWLLSRKTFKEVGPIDEEYFWSIEDVDYCQRVHRAGLRVVYLPEVSIVHHIGASSATLPNRTVISRHRGMWRYYKAYLRPGGRAAGRITDAAVWLGIQGRCLAILATNNARRAARRIRS